MPASPMSAVVRDSVLLPDAESSATGVSLDILNTKTYNQMNSKVNCGKLIFILLFFLSVSTFSQVRLPRLISDGMVLQRDAKVKIWGCC